MIYWFTQTITSSMRLYYELFHSDSSVFERAAKMYITTPTGTSLSSSFFAGSIYLIIACLVNAAVALFPREVTRWPRSWVGT